jgi:hypothetical protein
MEKERERALFAQAAAQIIDPLFLSLSSAAAVAATKAVSIEASQSVKQALHCC